MCVACVCFCVCVCVYVRVVFSAGFLPRNAFLPPLDLIGSMVNPIGKLQNQSFSPFESHFARF